jgi:uncharacterized protein YgbK (DUF1537 family)
MLLGAIADDFTGASDLANTLAKGGMTTTQFVGPGGDPIECEAGVVALKTRTVPVDQAVSQSLEAARWLLDQGCEQIIFKYCSTFDSTPEGNIGPVAEALLDLLGGDVAVVCPAFPATGRRLVMGHLFVGDRLLSESGMERHPLTPMTDPDIGRWLRKQTKGGIGYATLDTVRDGANRLSAALVGASSLLMRCRMPICGLLARLCPRIVLSQGPPALRSACRRISAQGVFCAIRAEMPRRYQGVAWRYAVRVRSRLSLRSQGISKPILASPWCLMH